MGVGLISYSAYLWHQPLLAFARIRNLDNPPQAEMLLLAAASIVIAYLSWRFVEQPFRKTFVVLGRPRVALTAALVVSITFLVVGDQLRRPSNDRLAAVTPVGAGQ